MQLGGKKIEKMLASALLNQFKLMDQGINRGLFNVENNDTISEFSKFAIWVKK